MCYHVKFDSSASKDMRINWREPPKLSSAGAPTSLTRGMVDPKNKPSHMCYRIIFGSSVTKIVCINKREPQNWWALGHRQLALWMRMTPRNTPFPTCCPVEFGSYRSNGTSKRSIWKIWPFASRLSRSLKVIGTNKYRSATYDFLLTFHSNNGPIPYCFQVKWFFQSKISNFSHFRCI